MTKVERIGPHELWLGDCREILPTLGKVDAVVTDPPYGVGFTGKVTKHSNRSGGDAYVDTEDNFRSIVMPAIELAIDQVGRAAIFTGVRRVQEYPTPRDLGGIICPNGGGRSPWGFGCYNPVLFYGSSPYLQAGKGSRPTATVMYHPGMHVTGENDNEHPCPKPIAFMIWLVGIASLPTETILDPFMGSGTTGVACVKLGRKFIGIEIEEKYHSIACRRIEEAMRQPDLFVESPKPAFQEALL